MERRDVAGRNRHGHHLENVENLEIYPSNSIAEQNYVLHFLNGENLRVSTVEVNTRTN